MERITKSIISTAVQTRFIGRESLQKLFARRSHLKEFELHTHEPSRITEHVPSSIVAGMGSSSRDLLDAVD